MAQAFDLMHALVAAVVVVVGRGGGVFFFIRSFLHTSLGRLYQPNSKRMFMFLFASGIYDARYNLGFSAFYVVCVCMVRSMLVRGKNPVHKTRNALAEDGAEEYMQRRRD